jgi:hypothetical protein
MEATMNKIFTGVLAAATLAGALTATTALPAAAADHHSRGGGHYEGHRGYRGDYRGYRGGWRGDGAAAALIGLAAGAAIAGGGYYGAPAYYAPPCRLEMRWNPYWGGYERVRVCY